MPAIKKVELVSFVEENIQDFHRKRLESLERLKLNTILKKKNPYLFKAKNILRAQDFVTTITDAFLSSQEESIFGGFLEQLAVFVCERVYGGRKSSTEGIDLEFEKDRTTYIVAIKSGPNWGNSQQIKRMGDNFKQAIRVLRTTSSRARNVTAVNGCCYGRDPRVDKGHHLKLCGQDFWELISGDKSLYIEIIEPLGHQAKERNEDFLKAYASMINQFTQEFMDSFCDDGVINWERLVRFNSSKDAKEVKVVARKQPASRPKIRLVPREKAKPHVSHLPVYSLKAAAGKFGDGQDVESEGWIRVGGRKLDKEMFVAQVVGHSMEPRIPDGSYCIFRRYQGGTREGKIVLVQYRGPADPDTGGSFAVKRYKSKKAKNPDGTWQHVNVILESLNSDYRPIEIKASDADAVKILAEFLTVLD